MYLYILELSVPIPDQASHVLGVFSSEEEVNKAIDKIDALIDAFDELPEPDEESPEYARWFCWNDWIFKYRYKIIKKVELNDFDVNKLNINPERYLSGKFNG